MNKFKENQLLLAAQTIKPRTSKQRRRKLARDLFELSLVKKDIAVSAKMYYLTLGTVPESLWTT